MVDEGGPESSQLDSIHQLLYLGSVDELLSPFELNSGKMLHVMVIHISLSKNQRF